MLYIYIYICVCVYTYIVCVYIHIYIYICIAGYVLRKHVVVDYHGVRAAVRPRGAGRSLRGDPAPAVLGATL